MPEVLTLWYLESPTDPLLSFNLRHYSAIERKRCAVGPFAMPEFDAESDHAQKLQPKLDPFNTEKTC
jgi:hypothetical protein